MGSLTAAAQALDLAITDVEGLCDLGGAGDIGKICGLYRIVRLCRANVSTRPCPIKTKCCGTARVVCEHFCRVTKDTWTGKVVEDAAPGRMPDSGDPEGDAGNR